MSFNVIADEQNKGWKMLLRMGWKKGKGLGCYEDGPSFPNLVGEDISGRQGFGLCHASERRALDDSSEKPVDSWELGIVSHKKKIFFKEWFVC